MIKKSRYSHQLTENNVTATSFSEFSYLIFFTAIKNLPCAYIDLDINKLKDANKNFGCLCQLLTCIRNEVNMWK